METDSTKSVTAERVEAIEVKLAFLEKTVDDLDGVVRGLNDRTDDLGRAVVELRSRLDALLEVLAGADEPRPPS